TALLTQSDEFNFGNPNEIRDILSRAYSLVHHTFMIFSSLFFLAVWMPRPTVPNCPAGLEYLTQVNQLLIKQKIELLEMLTNVETSNQYVCMNTMGQTIYHCREESNFCMRQCCKSGRAFTMHIHDNTGTEVIRVNRPYKYTCLSQCFSCMDCCQDEVEVEAPIGYVVGYVKQIMTDCTVRFQVQDAHRNSVLQIRGPSYCYCSCFGQDIPFVVTSVDGVSEIGRITKQWSNIMQELLTDADNFGVTFPLDLDVRVKATLLGAVFLIDFMFFEHNEQNNND
ncbi:Phospholipid scramblase, partial [Fasciola gigantica]